MYIRGTTQFAPGKAPLSGSSNPYALTQQSREAPTCSEERSNLRLGSDVSWERGHRFAPPTDSLNAAGPDSLRHSL